MIVTKDLRIDVLGESVFEGVNLVIRQGERLALFVPTDALATTFFRVLSGEDDSDAGKVLTEGERITYISAESIRSDNNPLESIFRERTTFVLLQTAHMTPEELSHIMNLLRDFKGGVIIASDNEDMISMLKVTRVLEIRDFAKTITSFTGTYSDYLIEREKDLARISDAYERQQREKKRLEDWLEQKRDAAAKNRSPQNGNTIRTKKKYLEREILGKFVPKPPEAEAEDI